MRERKTIENVTSWGCASTHSAPATNGSIDSATHNLILILEVLLDIRDILKKHDEPTEPKG
jgi:hypothetical protein